MVPTRIDAIARSLGVALSRPRLLGGTASGLVARLADARPARAPTVSCGPLGQGCGTGGDCCFNTRCQDGACRCEPGWDACGTGRCRYLRLDHHHCGACGTACGPSQQCLNGVCI